MSKLSSMIPVAAVAALFSLGYAAPASAALITVESGGISLNSTNSATAGTAADPWLINENMTSPGTIKLAGEGGSVLGSNTTGSGHASGKWFSKTVTNLTAEDWTSFELEMQVVVGTPSGEGDGLSFAQGAGLIFTSDKFASVTAIEDIRDYLNFHDGFVAIGETVTFMFAITDNIDNDPIFLLQTPNLVEGSAVPEPGTLALFGAALAGMAFVRRRKLSDRSGE